MTAGKEVPPRDDSFGAKHSLNLISAEASCLAIDLEDYVLVVVLLGFVEFQQADSRQGLYVLLVDLIVSAICVHDGPLVLEAGQAHGSRNFTHLSIGSKRLHLIKVDESEIDHEPDPIG